MLVCRAQITVTQQCCNAFNRDDAQHCRACGRPLRNVLHLRNVDDLIHQRFRVVRVLGFGNFGAVYESAIEGYPRERVALKETFDREQIPAFQREFQVLRGLPRHPHLPQYYMMFSEGERGYLVMELVPGQSLDDVLRARTELLPERVVLGYATQLCDALDFLHGQAPPILHRDIKPANIRLTDHGQIKLVDFGLLKQGAHATVPGTATAGTYAYSPVEQWSGGTDERSDIYSLGATLYHLLTGRQPVPALRRRGLPADPLAPPRQLNPRVSPALSEVVLLALRTDPAERFQSAHDLHAALLWAQQQTLSTRELAVAARPGTPATAVLIARGTTPLMNQRVAAPPAPAGPDQTTRPAPGGPRRVTAAAALARWTAHADLVNDLAWSPDGKLLASVGDDARLMLWGVGGGGAPAPIRTLLGGFVASKVLAWSPDGKLIATAGSEGSVRLWRVADGYQLPGLSGHSGEIFALAWSPDGQWIASGGWDRSVRIWRARDGFLHATLAGHMQSVSALAWSPDSAALASGGGDGSLRIWDLAEGRQRLTLRAHGGGVASLSWGRWGELASTGADRRVRLWRPEDGAALDLPRQGEPQAARLAWSPDGQLLAGACADGAIRIWTTAGHPCLELPHAHESRPRGLAWHPAGGILASAGSDRQIQLWELR